MAPWQLLTLEILVVASTLIVAYELRHRVGWSLLYIFVGSTQYLQTVLVSSLYLPLTPQHLVSPGSVVLFTSSLFAILLIYLREDLQAARNLIYGVLLSNITLAGLSQVTAWQLNAPGAQNFLDIAPEIFQVNARIFLVGTTTLAVDAFVIVLLYEYLRTRRARLPLAPRLVLTMVAVLVLDGFVFVTAAFFADPNYPQLLESNLVGKTFAGSLYGLILFGYLRVVGDREETERPPIRLGQMLSFLTYRAKYHQIQERLTAQRQQADEFRTARDAAVAADHAKTSYLANISHEIRTPLNGIIGTVELLSLSKQADPKQVHLIEVLKSSSKLLSRLIDDVLDLAKIETGNLSLNPTEMRLSECAANTVELYRNAAEEKGIELTLEFDPGLRGICWGDETRFRQILGNLVSNAVKFTPKGKVSVHLFDRGFTESRREVQLEVRDTGIGIPEQALEAVFDVYAQAESSTHGRFGGTGLGLAITRQLVEAHSGRIWVESEVGLGTTFRVRLTYSLEPDGLGTGTHKRIDLSADSIPVGYESATGTVLAVDDDEVSRMVVQALLESQGVTCHTVSDAHEAIEAFQELQPDLVLTDLNLGEISGVELSEKIRRLEGGSLVPIVAVTASALKTERDRCLEAGLDGYVTKPLDRDKLVRVLDEWQIPRS